MRRAVYAGSFDPLTNGHLWMIESGARLFDELVVAVGVNSDKKCAFSLDDRLDMLKKSVRVFPNVKVDSFENQFLVLYAGLVDAQYVLRGIRTGGDYEYERGMKNINSDLNPDITTIFLMPPREIAEISSSFVKGIVGPNEWEKIVENYVPRNVYNGLLVNFRGLEKRWSALWKQIGAGGNGKEAYNELISLYGEKLRAHHNFVHIVHALRELDELKQSINNMEQVELALWYHDAIYDTTEKNNEEKSGGLASQTLRKAGINSDFILGVDSLILATKHQAVPQKSDEKYLVDVDLSILGKSKPEFDEYERNIKAEYSWVPEEQFRQARTAILQGFLDRKSIYSTDFFRQKYETQARINLQRSIAQLKD